MDPKVVISEKSKITLKLSTRDFPSEIPEGIDLLPNTWIANNNEIDIMKNIWSITKDYELKTSNKKVLQTLEEIKK